MLPLDSYESFTSHLQDREYFGQKLGLERIREILSRLGNPHEKFRSIHIAGTNGKGSTAAMIASILQIAGHKVGLYTSPHLIDFCERIRVGGILITPSEVLKFAHRIREVEKEPLTFFEMATAIAFLHFAEEKISIGVIETGLGGRLDATNVMTPLLSIITSIGLDHTQHLGNTISAIAFEKAGIIKTPIPVIVGPLPPEALSVIGEQASKKGSRLIAVDQDLLAPDTEVGLPGRHQRTNAAMASAAANLLFVDRDRIRSGLKQVSWPARLQTLQEDPWVVLDGAHNPEAMRATASYIKENLRGRRLKVLFGAMADKDIPAILKEIAPLVDEFVFTQVNLKRSARTGMLQEAARVFEKKYQTIPDVAEAILLCRDGLKQDEVLLITGSLILAGNIFSEITDTSP